MHPSASKERWDNVEIQNDIKQVIKEWIVLNKLKIPKLYYEQFIYYKYLSLSQIKQFVSKYKIDETVCQDLPRGIVIWIIIYAGIQLTKKFINKTGFRWENGVEIEAYQNIYQQMNDGDKEAMLGWHPDDKNPLQK